jgi:uncharacterized protein YecE (DUF72 family)
MDFGRVPPSALAQIGFQLGADDPRTRLALARGAGSAHLELRLGCPVWAIKSWLGRVYPHGAASADFLHHYSRSFASIELNATHYRMPDAATIARWIDATPETFRFCPKFPQEISHRGNLSENAATTKEFAHQVLALEGRLGMSFLQLPPSFSPADLPELRRFLESLPRGFQLAVEVRHPAFFREHTLISPLFDLLASTGTHAVILDVSGRRDVLHVSLPTSRVMIRFVGNGLHPTDEPRLRAWTERIVSWTHEGLEELYFFIHQPDDVVAPEAVALMTNLVNSEFAARLPDALEKPLPLWKPLEAAPAKNEAQLKLL